MIGRLRQVISHFFSVAKVFLLFSCICFMPQLFFMQPKRVQPVWHNPHDISDFKLGIEQVTDDFLKQFCCTDDEMRIGFITNHAATDQQGQHAIYVLQQKGINIAKLFMSSDRLMKHNTDAELPFGKEQIAYTTVCRNRLDQSLLDDIDLLLFDMQDSGIRYASCAPYLLACLKAAQRSDIPLIVLDRPNRLGYKIEGTFCEDSTEPVPIRYGMTIGELAQFYNNYLLFKKTDMHVVPMHNYNRSCLQPISDDMPLTAPSSYSFCGMLQDVSPIDVGIGTDLAYSCITLPKSVLFAEQKWYHLRLVLRNMGIESELCRYFSHRKQEICRGLRLHIEDINQVDSFKVLLTVLSFFKQTGVILSFADSFDQAVGTVMVRKYIQGKVSKMKLKTTVNKELETFYRKAFGSFMYYPLPQVVLI